MRTIKLFVIISSILFSLTAQAKMCKPTEAMKNDYEPEIFSTSNDLLSPPGHEATFCGERIVIHGRVVDEDCRPVQDAKILLWQVGCDGKYPYMPLRNIARKNDEMINTSPENSFTGNGTAMTNNLGEFLFVTTYPNKSHDLSPHVNIRVEPHNKPSFQTKLFLQGNRIYDLSKIEASEKLVDFIMNSGTKLFHYEIVIPHN